MLGSLLLGLVSHSFLVQNRFFRSQTLRAGVHDNVRSATELVAREIRTTMEGGVVVAGSRTLTVRSPVTVTVVCGRVPPARFDVFSDGGEVGLDMESIAGAAVRDPSGAWEFKNRSWSAMNGGNPTSPQRCADNGADTLGVSGWYHPVQGLQTLLDNVPDVGEILVLFRETTFAVRTSALDPSTLALYRGEWGEPWVEFATGIDSTATFEYRTVGGSYVDTVAVGLDQIDAVRMSSASRAPPATGGALPIEYGWSVTIPLRSVR